MGPLAMAAHSYGGPSPLLRCVMCELPLGEPNLKVRWERATQIGFHTRLISPAVVQTLKIFYQKENFKMCFFFCWINP